MLILCRAVRVYQWPKNLAVFAALVFAQQIHRPEQVARSILAFLALCLASSAVYLFNDVVDVRKDRGHPEKRLRPVASGAISITAAVVLMIVLGVLSAGGGFLLNTRFGIAVAAYMSVMVGYTLFLKHVVIIDALVVALGFVVRAVSGALVLNVEFSNWLVVCTLFLALFLSLGKRRREMELMGENAGDHREVLGHYSVPFLDNLIMIMAAATLLTYTIYTCSPEVVHRVGTDKLYITLPFVVYGLFRYLYLVHRRSGGGDPSRTLLEDGPLILAILGWGLACLAILYSVGPIRNGTSFGDMAR